MNKKKNTAIVLAAGQGKRMESTIQKQFLYICGKPVVYYSLKCFQESSDIDEIILVVGESEVSYCKEEIVEKYNLNKVSCIVPGGRERYDSVYQGLLKCEDCGFVLIHDGARPFVDEGIIKRTLDSAREFSACVAAVPVKDTIKIADEQGFIAATPNRDTIWTIQTPQVFAYDLVRSAYDKLMTTEMAQITDDARVVEAMEQYPVKLVEGCYRNIKITTPEDLEIAEMFVEKKLVTLSGY